METLQATVNPRLLAKADRLFTGTLQGRIIEILQNARRAGATTVRITNRDGMVKVQDDGRGVEDFSKLLDLGGSGWDETLEASEDPAGVGLFCLMPRELTVCSHSRKAIISGDGWTGAPVNIQKDTHRHHGTILSFADEPWGLSEVAQYAIFTGMKVTVDGRSCPRQPFLSAEATDYPALGCRIEVREAANLSEWHRIGDGGLLHTENVLVNFHGQVAGFHHHLVAEHHLHFLVELTGEPTGIRLLLPARTRLIENQAYRQLQAALELEAYRHLQRRGHHRLPYTQYLRARELGIMLTEATPTYRVGTLSGDRPEPISVTKPDSFPLAQCYRFQPDAQDRDESDAANVHLLAALTTRRLPIDRPARSNHAPGSTDLTIQP